MPAIVGVAQIFFIIGFAAEYGDFHCVHPFVLKNNLVGKLLQVNVEIRVKEMYKC